MSSVERSGRENETWVGLGAGDEDESRGGRRRRDMLLRVLGPGFVLFFPFSSPSLNTRKRKCLSTTRGSFLLFSNRLASKPHCR